MKVPYTYLDRQFADIQPYIDDIKALAKTGDFTLGRAVTEFEEKFSKLTGIPYVIGVSSGTDALILSLKALGIGPGDEVITPANTFIGTAGAVAMVGATPVFVDNNEQYTLDTSLIEKAITSKTKAIIPVHLCGCPADMPKIMEIAKDHKLFVIEDAAQAILACIDGKHVGSFGDAAAFSLHPLKNLNVWGDGGVIVTHSKELNDKLRLLRNHGLINRDEAVIYGHNCRLDSLHAVIANRLIGEIHGITDQRIKNAACFDEALKGVDGIMVPVRDKNKKHVYHTYVIQAKRRDDLIAYLGEKGVEAKIHYPIPLHLQKASEYLGYKEGDFPVCERHCKSIITLPVHQHLATQEINYIIDSVRAFYH